MELLINNPKLALVRSSTSYSYAHLTNEYVYAGKNAFLEFFLTTNYITGIIYNTEIIQKYYFIKFIINNKNNIACAIYPHMWLDALMSFKGDCCQDSNKLCIEGEAELHAQIPHQNKRINQTDISSSATNMPIPTICDLDNLPTIYSYQNRIEQHFGFIELIKSLPQVSDKILLTAYLQLCYKTNFLVSLVKSFYIKHGYSWNDIYDELYKCCIEGIDKLGININSEVRNVLINHIAEQNKKFRNI